MIKYLIALLLVTSCLFSCRKTSTGLDNNILVEMRKGWRNNNLFLRCSTVVASYPCSNTRIAATLEKDTKNIIVRLGDIVIPQTCYSYANNKYGAMGEVDLGYLNGTYALTIVNGNEEVTCRLIVDSISYQIDHVVGTSVSFAYNELFRMPRNSIWGLIEYKDAAENAALAKEFVDSVSLLGTQPFTGPAGYYTGIFPLYFDSKQPVRDTTYPFNNIEKRFIFNYTGNVDDLDSLVRRYKKKHEGKIYPNIYTFDDQSLGQE